MEQVSLLSVSQRNWACLRCRRENIRCDGKSPACSPCERSNLAAVCSSLNDQDRRGVGVDKLVSNINTLKKPPRIQVCSRCRGRKTKCDGKLPACSPCERNQVAECSYLNNQDTRGVRVDSERWEDRIEAATSANEADSEHVSITDTLKKPSWIQACSRCRNRKTIYDGKLLACSACERSSLTAESSIANDQENDQDKRVIAVDKPVPPSPKRPQTVRGATNLAKRGYLSTMSQESSKVKKSDVLGGQDNFNMERKEETTDQLLSYLNLERLEQMHPIDYSIVSEDLLEDKVSTSRLHRVDNQLETTIPNCLHQATNLANKENKALRFRRPLLKEIVVFSCLMAVCLAVWYPGYLYLIPSSTTDKPGHGERNYVKSVYEQSHDDSGSWHSYKLAVGSPNKNDLLDSSSKQPADSGLGWSYTLSVGNPNDDDNDFYLDMSKLGNARLDVVEFERHRGASMVDGKTESVDSLSSSLPQGIAHNVSLKLTRRLLLLFDSKLNRQVVCLLAIRFGFMDSLSRHGRKVEIGSSLQRLSMVKKLVEWNRHLAFIAKRSRHPRSRFIQVFWQLYTGFLVCFFLIYRAPSSTFNCLLWKILFSVFITATQIQFRNRMVLIRLSERNKYLHLKDSIESGNDTLWLWLDKSLVTLGFLYPPVKRGKKRLLWACHCGHTSFDDFIKLCPGGAQRHQTYLCNCFLSKSSEKESLISGLVSRGLDQVKRICGGSNGNRRTKSNQLSSLPRYTTTVTSPPSNATALTAPSSDKLALLLCIPHRKYATKLIQPDLKEIQSDQAFFNLLKNSYRDLRGRFRSAVSFKTLKMIKFVQFELYRSELVDIRKQDDMPPEDRKNEYRYNPIPAEIIPPIGENHMMHLFTHPEDADDVAAFCLDRIPKKLKDRLLVCPTNGTGLGWGIHFIEGWHYNIIWLVAFIVFLLASLVFLICWSVLKHDIQGASGVAAYTLTFLTLLIGSVQATFELN